MDKFTVRISAYIRQIAEFFFLLDEDLLTNTDQCIKLRGILLQETAYNTTVFPSPKYIQEKRTLTAY
jgi:hypothetical protein